MESTDIIHVDGKIGQSYFFKKLGGIPRERIKVYSSKIIYGTLFGTFFITMDGCKTIKRWNETEDCHKSLKTIPYGYTMQANISFFKAANLCRDGSILLTVDESYLVGERELWAVSTDGAESWAYKDARPKC